MMGRLIIVSNRVAIPNEHKNTSGGLAVALLGLLENSGGIWFGWNGEIVEESLQNKSLDITEYGKVTFATTGLTKKDYEQYYQGFSNGALWPILHYRPDYLFFKQDEYEGYERVNQLLASKLAPLLLPDDVIWVHDYHLIPFAKALRTLKNNQKIGFFLHTPFPDAQVLSHLSHHQAIIKSLCHYDLVGFQTNKDLIAFQNYMTKISKGEVLKEGIIKAHGFQFKAGAYPIGIFPDVIQAQAIKELEINKEVNELKKNVANGKLIISVDRLDYSKGIAEGFKAFECLLESAPEQRGKATLLQIAPPTRTDVTTYQQIRRNLEYEAGRINGHFSSFNWVPIHYINRSYNRDVLMALFRLAHIGFVTPLRDGMNLVAKEYVASQDPDNPGVLILSTFAGAAAELTDALIVNPYDVSEVCHAFQRALKMDYQERKERYEKMMAVLRKNNLSVWRDHFLHDLNNNNNVLTNSNN